MNWLLFTQLILEVGLPAAERIFQKWQSGNPVTQADIDELKALGLVTPKEQLLKALAAAGVASGSPEASALLALIPPAP